MVLEVAVSGVELENGLGPDSSDEPVGIFAIAVDIQVWELRVCLFCRGEGII